MSYLALYRKYRPDTFDKLIGQEHIVKTLVNQIRSERLGHAYLFTGTRGTGKTSAAKIFAKAINCENPVNGSPCGKCASCLALSEPSNIDVIEIDAASNNGVNEIRELREKVQYPPVSCRYKVYIVDEVHMLTGAAFNALLKTLEEPPRHAVFILATTEAHKIPATILSRCMRFDFRLIPTEKIAALIGEIYDEQGKKYEKEAVFAIARAGEGSIRDALSVADVALSYGTGTLTYADVTEILGSTSAELLYDFASALIGGDTGKVIQSVDRLATLGKSMGVLTKDITAAIRDVLVVKTCENAQSILGLPADKFAELKRLADSACEEQLLRAMEIFAEAETSLKFTTHPRVVFETAAIKAAKPQIDYNIEALMGRIKTLEDKLSDGRRFAPFSGDKNPESDNNATVTPPHSPSECAPEKAESTVAAPAAVADFDTVSAETLKGKLLSGLRKTGSEMLWNVMQNVAVDKRSGVLILSPASGGDYAVIDIPVNREKIAEALSEFGNFEIKIVEPRAEKRLDAVDEATEKIKKIFGDDIVIIKN